MAVDLAPCSGRRKVLLALALTLPLLALLLHSSSSPIAKSPGDVFFFSTTEAPTAGRFERGDPAGVALQPSGAREGEGGGGGDMDGGGVVQGKAELEVDGEVGTKVDGEVEVEGEGEAEVEVEVEGEGEGEVEVEVEVGLKVEEEVEVAEEVKGVDQEATSEHATADPAPAVSAVPIPFPADVPADPVPVPVNAPAAPIPAPINPVPVPAAAAPAAVPADPAPILVPVTAAPIPTPTNLTVPANAVPAADARTAVVIHYYSPHDTLDWMPAVFNCESAGAYTRPLVGST